MEQIIKFLNEGDYFVVTSHVSPDGDNIGSTLGIYYYLKNINKNVYYVLDDEIPQNLGFLVDGIDIISSEKFQNLNLDYYNLISLDCGDMGRICVAEEIIKNASKLICIDHHASNNNYGDLNYVVAGESSTCELVYNILYEIGLQRGEHVIDSKMATALYTGVVTDTGKFTYQSTHPSTFEMAKNLLIFGADNEKAVSEVYRNNSQNYYKLLGEVLNTLNIVDEKIAVITLTTDMLERNNMDIKDVDEITPYCIDIKGVEVGIFIKQKAQNTIKVSIRSKEYVDVNVIASAFNGGGHKRAAGITLFDTSVQEATKKVVQEAQKYI